MYLILNNSLYKCLITHCNGSGCGGGIIKISLDTILQPPPRQNNFTAIAPVCGDLNSDVKCIKKN